MRIQIQKIRSYQKSRTSVLGAGAWMALIALLVLGASASYAANDDDSDQQEAKTTHAVSAEKERRHQYPGGRDEEELTVQSALAQPVRSPDGTPGATEPSAAEHD